MKIFQFFSILFITTQMLACKSDAKNTSLQSYSDIASPTLSKRFIKVALLLDTSNSMDGLIDQAKAQLWEIVNELSYAKCKHEQPNLQIALYEYGNDRLNERTGYIRKILPFTSDLDDISKELFSLTTNGGSEYCGTVIKASLDQLDWGNEGDDLKLIFIAGNEPFTQGKIDYRDAANEAKEKEVVINTIFCGNYEQGIDTYWKDGAILAYGDYMAIDHNKHTVHIASPYDDPILQLNVKLNATYIPYGALGKEKADNQAMQDINAETYSKANAVSRTVSKGGRLYKNSTWDLVDAKEEESFSYDDIKMTDLPSELQKMSKEELERYVELKQKERESIQSEIAELNKKRSVYIESKKTDGTNQLENAMLEAIKKQAKKKNYSWE